MRNGGIFANISLDGLIYLILGLIWLIAQIAGAASRGRRRRDLGHPVSPASGQGARGPEAGDNDVSEPIPLDPESALQSFLEDLAKRREAGAGASRRSAPSAAPDASATTLRWENAQTAAATPPPPHRLAPSVDGATAGLAAGVIVAEPVRVGSIRPHSSVRFAGPSTGTASFGANARVPVLALPGISLPRMPYVASAAGGSFTRSDGAGKRVMSRRGPLSPRGLRDAIVLKALLDPPGALTPPGNVSWMDPMQS